VAHVGDQRYWADRLARLGVGAAPLDARSVSGEVLARAALETADSDVRREAAVRLAGRLATEDGAATAVRLIEATARRGPGAAPAG
jgi:UDP:flavonoid glycosyltransferase YjiC (YdhE family)